MMETELKVTNMSYDFAKYSQTSLIRPSLIQLFANPAKNLLEQIFPH